jgi:hypothetical protein
VIQQADRSILCDLAKQVAEVAALPIQTTRRRQWVRHNSLQTKHPMMLVFPEGAWEAAVRKYIRRALEITQREGCVLEIVLKDTHTCEHRPERFDRWTQIARQEIEHRGT